MTVNRACMLYFPGQVDRVSTNIVRLIKVDSNLPQVYDNNLFRFSPTTRRSEDTMFQSIGDGFDYNKRKALEYTKLTLFFFQSDHPVNLPGRLILTFHSTFYTI